MSNDRESNDRERVEQGKAASGVRETGTALVVGKRLCLAAAVLFAAGCGSSAGSRGGVVSASRPSAPVAQPAGSNTNSVRDLRLTALNSDGRTTRNVDDGGELHPGDKVKVCFGVDRGGYVSLWSNDAENVLTRVVPNKFMAVAKNGVEVSPGDYCVADNGLVDAGGERVAPGGTQWWLEVIKPYGEAELFLYWTAKAAEQPSEKVFVDIDSLSVEVRKKRSANRGGPGGPRSGGLVIGYRVVPAGGGQ